MIGIEELVVNDLGENAFLFRKSDELIEFGPVNASIHKLNEHVNLADIEPLSEIYFKTLENILNV